MNLADRTIFRILFRGPGALALAGVLGGTLPAFAQSSPEEKPLATSLFLEGRSLMAAGKIPEACRKLEESLRLDPGAGTLLNVALCHEKEGKTASAWAEFTESASLARTQSRPDRLSFAQEHLTALQPTLSKLIIMVPPTVDDPELTVKQDGRVVRRAAWGTPIPVDPGPHTLEWVSPKKKPSSVQVTIGKANDLQTVNLTPLEDAPPPPPPPPQLHLSGSSLSSYDPGSKPRQIVGVAVGGLGLGAIGVATYFGLDAFAKKKQADNACRGGCSQDGVNINDKAGNSADLSTAGFAIGVTAVVAGTWLFVSGLSHGTPPTTGGEPKAAPSHSTDAAPALVPGFRVGSNEASLELRGRF
jgi:hypothetical protein